MLDIALFSDRHMLPGLHVTLLTLLDSLKPGEGRDIVLHLFMDQVSPHEQELLRRTHALNPQGTTLLIRDHSPKAPEGGNPLHGNETAYGRLQLAELLPDSSRCLYLDTDLFVNRSVRPFFDEFDDVHLLLADGEQRRSYCLDIDLFNTAGLSLDGPYFNTGVLGINLDLWRERKASETCRQVAAKYSGLFRSADQALLNLAFHDAVKCLGLMWNNTIFPMFMKVETMAECIYHFVAAPKPWDPPGRWMNNNYHLWRNAYARTAIGQSSYLKYSSIRRTLTILRQSYTAWKAIRRTRKSGIPIERGG